MNHFDPWDAVDRECLLLAIEQSLRVRAQPHFFTWTQGVLQGLIPHQVMFFATYDGRAQVIFADVLCPMRLSEEARNDITRADTGLTSVLLRTWEHGGRVPLLIDPRNRHRFEPGPVPSLMDALGFENIAAHGSWGAAGATDAFFGFAGVAKPLDERLATSVELILPHLRVALFRVQPRKVNRTGLVRRQALTGREAEILQLLRHGRSNAEIGVSLAISPLTVKNHVQKVLRKLGVRNRTQAVALGLDLDRPRDG